MTRYRWVAARKAEGFPITMAVEVAGVSRQAFNDWFNTYNHQRLHPSLRYQTPVAWENQYCSNPAARTNQAA